MYQKKMDEWLEENAKEIDIDAAYAGVPSEERQKETTLKDALENVYERVAEVQEKYEL